MTFLTRIAACSLLLFAIVGIASAQDEDVTSFNDTSGDGYNWRLVSYQDELQIDYSDSFGWDALRIEKDRQAKFGGDVFVRGEAPRLEVHNTKTTQWANAEIVLRSMNTAGNERFSLYSARDASGAGNGHGDFVLRQTNGNYWMNLLRIEGESRNLVFNQNRSSDAPSYGNVLFRETNVGIGTTSPGEKLSVNGKIRSKEVIVENTNWPDFVFASDYDLRTLDAVDAFIDANGHLPGVPSADVVERDGQRVGATQATLLQKIEELTLYAIDQHDRAETLQRELDAERTRNAKQQNQIEALQTAVERLQHLAEAQE